jgi:hypothetical protein
MAGGLLQIVAYGAQDMYLTNEPQITFFKTVYKRHTNFSLQTFTYALQNNPTFGTSNEIIIHRNGDLITRMYLRIVISSVILAKGAKFAWTKRLGHALINSITFQIGGQVIDKQTGTWLDIWHELSRNDSHDRGYDLMIGDTPSMTSYNNKNKPEYILFIPLQFWFNRLASMALPMISLQYHQVSLKFEFNKIENLIIRNNTVTDTSIKNINFIQSDLLVDFAFLDTIERKKYASLGHEYLIEQIQTHEPDTFISSKKRTRLFFNQPCKEIFWQIRNGFYSGQRFLCYTDTDWSNILIPCALTILKNSMILLNGPIYDDTGNNIIQAGENPPFNLNATWEEFEPGANSFTTNGQITIINNNLDMSLWINTSSLLIGTYNLFSKITASIMIIGETITINSISTTLTIRDISFPISQMIDSRVDSDDVIVNIFSNYGILIDGSSNPINESLLIYNHTDRIDKRSGNYFNYLQPYIHHSNTPKDGINCYSFAKSPQEHQPSGTSNLSVIENVYLVTYLKDTTFEDDLPIFNILNQDTHIYIFAFSYNILKISNGMGSLIYNR